MCVRPTIADKINQLLLRDCLSAFEITEQRPCILIIVTGTALQNSSAGAMLADEVYINNDSV